MMDKTCARCGHYHKDPKLPCARLERYNVLYITKWGEMLKTWTHLNCPCPEQVTR